MRDRVVLEHALSGTDWARHDLSGMARKGEEELVWVGVQLFRVDVVHRSRGWICNRGPVPGLPGVEVPVQFLADDSVHGPCYRAARPRGPADPHPAADLLDADAAGV